MFPHTTGLFVFSVRAIPHLKAEGVVHIRNSKPTVMKFGGTCVEDAQALQRVVEIVSSRQSSAPVVVVSAMAGFTDGLLECWSNSADGKVEVASQILNKHLDRHAQVVDEFDARTDFITTTLNNSRDELITLFEATNTRTLSPPLLQDLIVSYGERLSASLLAAVMNKLDLSAQYVDSRRCILTNGDHGRAEPLVEQTEQRTRAELDPLLLVGKIPVMGGFIGSTADGTTTTLGRGGSDYTAALVASALGAYELQIWTDVPGVLTADPRILPQARTIPRLSYAEAAELAYFGAKVLHPKTIQPAVEQNIPVHICNAREPEEQGTIVWRQTEVSPQAVKAIAHKTGITLVQITSARMLGAHGFLHAIFEIFNRHRTAIDVVTTSEVSVSLSLEDASALPAIVVELKELGKVHIETQRAIICVVGEGLRATPGVAARVFGSLRDINISLISQGASRINLTFVIEEEAVADVISRLHETFLLSDVMPVREKVSA